MHLLRPQCYEIRYKLQEKKKGNTNIRNTNTQRINNTFLNNQQVTEEIKREIKKIIETNDNENRTTQNLWDVAKAVLRGKFTAIQSYFRKQEKHQTDKLTLHLKQLDKEEQKPQNQQKERHHKYPSRNK